MTDCSVLKGFRCATQGDDETSSDESSTSSTGTSDFFDPSLGQINDPVYNYSFE